MSIAIIGVTKFAKRLESQLNNKNVESLFISELLRDIDFKKLKSYSIIHFMWSPTLSIRGFLTLIRLKLMHKKIIVSWIGSDVLFANTRLLSKLITKISQGMIDANLTDSENLKKELNQIGIKAKLQIPPFFSLFKINEIPNQKRVGVYLPDKYKQNWSFYQGDIIKKLVKSFPDVEFIIVPNTGKNFSEKNVKCIKWTDNMEEIYSQVMATIRLPRHDGLSNTIMEVLSMGRNMISSPVEFPFCKIVHNYNDAKNHLEEVIKNPSLNLEGSEYVHKKYDNNKFAEEILSIYNNLLMK